VGWSRRDEGRGRKLRRGHNKKRKVEDIIGSPNFEVLSL